MSGRGQSRWSTTVAGTNGGATATYAAGAAGSRHAVGAIQCSGDAAALVTVESPAATVLYRKRFAAAFNMSERFDPPLVGAAASAVVVKVSASTSNSESNVQGITEV